MIFYVISNETYDEGEYALYDKNADTVIMSGDYYHDKIESQIEGFFKALQYLKQPYSKIPFLLTPEKNIELWNKCEFYDGRED